MATLELGHEPGQLYLNLVSGDAFGSVLTLTQNGTPIPWPAAPDLEFSDGSKWTATLSASGAVANATATFTATEPQVTAVLALSSPRVRLAVSGVSWWIGRVIPRA